jgi:hypothetical protein
MLRGYNPLTFCLVTEPVEVLSSSLFSRALPQEQLLMPTYLQGAQYEGLPAMFVEVLEGFGGFWVNPDTNEVGLDKPEAIKAVEFLRNVIDRGIAPPGVTTYREEDTRRLFLSGDTAFLRNEFYLFISSGSLLSVNWSAWSGSLRLLGTRLRLKKGVVNPDLVSQRIAISF